MSDSVSIGDASVFQQSFNGNLTHYGQFIPGDVTKEGEKLEGVAKTVKNQLGIEQIVAHLEGRIGLGIVPIYDDQWVDFSVIDVDSYDNTFTHGIIDMVQRYALPFLPFRSKSGGLHLYIFYSEKVLASESIALLKEYLIIFNLPKKTEIFPKQAVLKGSAIGNWINLPYFGGDDTSRYLIEGRHKPSLMYALTKIAQNRYTMKQAREVLKSLPLADGPPCLQHITMQGSLAEGAGNNYFFSLARYWKIKDESELDTQIIAANEALEKPMEMTKLRATLESAKKTDASFLCSQEPLLSLCKRPICALREFGIEHVDISNFTFGQLIKYDADPPYYVWKIDNADLEFMSEDALLNQREFQKLCVRMLHRVPKLLKESAWWKIVNNALSNMIVVKISREDDFSIGAMFWEYVAEFLENRNKAETKSQISMGAVFKDMETNTYLFKPKVLFNFLSQVKSFRMTTSEIQARLRKNGGEGIKVYLDAEQGQERVWKLPFEAIQAYITTKPKNVDFEAMADRVGGDF